MNKNLKITTEFLTSINACAEGKDWVAKYTDKEPIAVIKHLVVDDKWAWANWLIVRIMDYKEYISYGVFAALQVIDNYERKYPNDDRPRKAIEAAQKCINNPTQKKKDAAYSAACSAADSVYSAADSAYSAAYSAAGSAVCSAADSAYSAVCSAADSAGSAACSAAYSAGSAVCSAADSAYSAVCSAADSAVCSAADSAYSAVCSAYSAADSAACSAGSAVCSAADSAACSAGSAMKIKIIEYGISLLTKNNDNTTKN